MSIKKDKIKVIDRLRGHVTHMHTAITMDDDILEIIQFMKIKKIIDEMDKQMCYSSNKQIDYSNIQSPIKNKFSND